MVLELKNLRIWDGLSDNYSEGNLTIKEGLIDELPGRPSGDAIDCRGLTVIPGLIDAHVHMVLDPAVINPSDQHTDLDSLMPAMIERAEAMLAAGITTARDLGGGNWYELMLRDKIRDQAVLGPRLLCAGQPITSKAGHCHFWGGEADNVKEVLDVLNRQVEKGVDLIKVMATGGSLTKGSRPVDAQFSKIELSAIVERAAASNLTVAAHCHGVDGIANAAQAKVSTIEHCSWVGSNGWGMAYDQDVAETISKNQIRVSPTINAGWERLKGDEKRVARVQAHYSNMRDLGVVLIASTDAGIPNVYHHHLPKALPVFQFFAGLSPVETLRAATSDCAFALGLGASLGRIQQGFIADLLFLEGDPLADLNCLDDVKGIISQGRIIRNPDF